MKRVFISFAIEDEQYRNLLVGQSKNENVPFSFTDMSVKQPWSSEWKTKCRTRIKGCDGVIALISSNTKNASGARWEIQCAQEEGIPVYGMYVSGSVSCDPPPELAGKMIRRWSWPTVKSLVDNF